MLTGCTVTTKGPSISSGASVTVGGETTGSEQSSSDNGSASFNVNNGTVTMSNFSFNTSYTPQVELVNDGITHTKCTLHDGQNVIMFVFDGHYTEPFSIENSARQFNDLYQKVFKATDSPFTTRVDQMANSAYKQGVIGIGITLNDCDAAIYAKEGTDQWGIIAFIPGQDDAAVTAVETQLLTAFGAQQTPQTSTDVSQQTASPFDAPNPIQQSPQVQTSPAQQEIPITDSSVTTSTESVPAASTENTSSDYGQMYTIKVDGKLIGLDNFGAWEVSQTDENMCTIYPNDDTVVRYYDSGCRLDDTEKFDKEGNIIATSYNVAPKMYTLDGNYGTEYLITWEYEGIKYAEYFQVLPNIGTYMETDITAYNSSSDILDLVDLYTIVF